MLYQGLFNLLDLYFKEEELFYNNIEHFFREKITSSFGDSQIDDTNINQKVEELTKFLVDIFVELDFDKTEIETEFLDPFLEIREEDRKVITFVIDLYERKFAPIIYEILLVKIVDYLVDAKVAPLILKLKANGFLPIEFIMELRNLKTLIEKYPDKRENLRKYFQIREKIVGKFKTRKFRRLKGTSIQTSITLFNL